MFCSVLIFNVCCFPAFCRHSPCLPHTFLSCASSSLFIPTWRTSTWRFSTHAVVRPVLRVWCIHTCWVEDVLKKDTMVQSQWNLSTILLELIMKMLTKLVFFSCRSESSRNDCTSFKHNPRGKDNCLQSQPAAFGMVHYHQICPTHNVLLSLMTGASAFTACATLCATVKQVFIYKKQIFEP